MPMTAREGIRLILDGGGKKVRSGKKHDIYVIHGIPIAIPRHKGDLSKGVERQIKEALGK